MRNKSLSTIDYPVITILLCNTLHFVSAESNEPRQAAWLMRSLWSWSFRFRHSARKDSFSSMASRRRAIKLPFGAVEVEEEDEEEEPSLRRFRFVESVVVVLVFVLRDIVISRSVALVSFFCVCWE